MIELHLAATGQSIKIDPDEIGRMCRTFNNGMEFTEVRVGGQTHYIAETPTEISALRNRAIADAPPTYAEVEGAILRGILDAIKHRELSAADTLSQTLARLTSTAHLGRCK